MLAPCGGRLRTDLECPTGASASGNQDRDLRRIDPLLWAKAAIIKRKAFMLHLVKNLSPEQKLTVERLLGHTLSEDESVSIKTIRPSEIIPSHLSGEQR